MGKKIGIVGSIGATAILILLLFGPNIGVVADYNQGPYLGFTAGVYGNGNDDCADPATRGDVIPAYHTQDASLGDVLVQVYVVGSGDDAAIRLAISTNGGTSFAAFEWVSSDMNVKQDYPDVQLYEDTTDSNAVKAVVVWQEKPDDDSKDWCIKARERSFKTGTWGSVKSVSNTDLSENDNDNIYPKISTCSDNSVSYWNIVWQREWDGLTNRYGIYLRRYVRDTNNEGFNSIVTIAQPSDNDDDYKHPATDCIPDSTNYEVVYIIYDEYHSGETPDNIIKLTYGSPSGSSWGTFTASGNVQVDTSDDGDLSQDYPDIAVVESADGQNVIVDCVWIENDNSDEVKYKRSTNGGSSFGSEVLIDDDGYMSLRSVAVDSCVSITKQNPLHSKERCHVIWTTGNDVYYRDRLGTDGNWGGNFGPQKDGATTQYNEAFVDVSTSAPTPSSIIAYAVWDVSGTAVFFGWD